MSVCITFLMEASRKKFKTVSEPDLPLDLVL